MSMTVGGGPDRLARAVALADTCFFVLGILVAFIAGAAMGIEAGRRLGACEALPDHILVNGECRALVPR